MLRHLRSNAVAYVALFVALGGTGAYAANTVFSADIVDGEVKNADIAATAVTFDKLAGGAVTQAKLATNAVTNLRIAANAVTGAKVADASLTDADIDESTLGLVRGPGRVGRWAFSLNFANDVYFDPAGRFKIRVGCPASVGAPSFVYFYNLSSMDGNAFVERGRAPGTVTHDPFTPNDDGTVTPTIDDEVHVDSIAAAGDRASFSIQFGNGDVVQIDGFYIDRTSNCHTQGTVLYSGSDEGAAKPAKMQAGSR